MHTHQSAYENQSSASSYPEGGVAPLRHALGLHTYQQKKQMHAHAAQPLDLLGLLGKLGKFGKLGQLGQLGVGLAGLLRLLPVQRNISTCAMPSSSYGADTVTKPKLA
jgi:hypothetical protein